MTQKNILYKKGLLVIALLATPFVNGREDVTLAAVATASALDKINGDFYVGLAIGADVFAVTKIGTDGTETAIGTHADITGETIRLLTLSMNGSSARPVVVESSTNNTKFSIMQSDGSGFATSGTLNDAEATAIEANGIRAIAASGTTVYSAVADGGTNWAAANRGISVNPVSTADTPVITADEAAQAVLATTSTDGTTHATTTAATLVGDPILYWDEPLNRLYCACDATAGNAFATDRARSVLVRDEDGAAVASVAAGGLAFEDLATGIMYTNQNTSVSVHNIGVMHTTTGHDYLIINGGNGLAAATANKVYAIPLVPSTDPTAANVGTFAGDSLNTAGPYIQATSATGQLCINTDTHAIVGAADAPFTADSTTTMQVVGDTVYLATQALTVDTDDEVGIFSSTAQFNEHGKIVNWSRWTRACPAEMGTSAVNGDIFTFAIDAKRGKTFAVDGLLANRDHVAISSWGEEASATVTDLATAVNTDLTKGCYSILSLDRTVANFGNNAASRYAIFGGYEQVVFTLVSRKDADTVSYNKSETPVAATAFGTSPSATYNVISTGLSGTGKVTALGLKGLNATPNTAYFLAGTENGLYALAKSDAGGEGGGVGAGGTLDTANGDDHINNLNGDDTGPEDNTNGFFKADNVPTWQSVTTITREVKKIASSANATYVLESGGTSTTGDRLLVNSDATDATVATLSAGFLAIAEAGTNATDSDLRGFNFIYDFVVITGAADGTEDQVILATDNGLYQSKTDDGVQAAANQADALWSPIGDKLGNSDTTGVIYTKLFTTPGTNLISSFYAKRYVDGSGSPETYMNSTIDLFCCSTANTGITGNVVKRSERNDGRNNGRYSDSLTAFLYPNRIQGLFTDGGRRWFVERSADGTSANNTQIRTMPFHVGSSDWSVTDPVTPLSNTTLDALGSINAISLLPNGYLALGTDTGIVLAS